MHLKPVSSSPRPLAEPGIFLEISTDNRLAVPVSPIYNMVFMQGEKDFLEKRGDAGEIATLLAQKLFGYSSC